MLVGVVARVLVLGGSEGRLGGDEAYAGLQAFDIFGGDLPIVILFAFSFFETKTFVTIYKPTLNTWYSLFESGRFEVTLRTLRIALKR